LGFFFLRFASFVFSASHPTTLSPISLPLHSTGKTSFVEFCLGRPYPGSHIAPEPSTDRFVVVAAGPEDRRTPGHTLVVQPDLPYTSLASFGNGFLSKLEGVAVAGAPILESLTFVDSPGVLSGEKQRVERSFNFMDVVSHLASRADAVYLFFDPAKLDVSDEFKAVIGGLDGQTEKVRVVLNKCDTVTAQELMRVYGSLMYSLARVTRAPEVPRVYVGSFKPGAGGGKAAGMPGGAGDLFAAEAGDLLADLAAIPSRAMDRKVADLVKRVRAARIHALIIGHLRRQLPAVVGRAKAQAKLLADLPAAFEAIARERRLPLSDFPDPARYRSILSSFALEDFPKLRDRDIKAFEDVLAVDIPALVRRFDNPYGPAGGGAGGVGR
jgi:EH domain-containing protein 1